MSTQVVFTGTAKNDLREIAVHLAKRSGSRELAVRFVREHFPGVTVTKPEGTYMLFLDCAGWCQAHDTGMDDLIRAGEEVGVIWEDGRSFHGPSHIRMNLALPLSRVQEAFDRLDRYVFNK